MGEWLSTFLMNPALAVGGAAVASPILIHIFSKRRYHRIRWAAMDFLLEAQRKNRRRVRMEQLILLALRCLAVLLIAFMIARPFVRTSAVGALLGAGGRTERIVLMDDSFSMGYRLSDGSSVFQQAMGATRKIAKWAASETPRDSLTVLTTSRPRQPVVALASLSDESLRRLDDPLDGLAPSQTTARFPDASAVIAELIRKSPAQANTAVYVISDFQRQDWSRPAASEAVCPALAPLAELTGRPGAMRLTLVDVGAESPRNIAITDLSPMQPQVVAGVPARYEIAVANYGADPLDHVALSVGLSRHTLAPVSIPRIQPGQVVREPLEVTFPQDGADYFRVQLAAAGAAVDALPIDNSRAGGVDVAAAVHVLVVNGEPGADALRDEAHLLKTALHPAGRAASGNEVTVVTEQELDAVEWPRYHVVVLANVARLSLAGEQALFRFVEAGGGLIVFCGDLVDPAFYNRELYRDGAGLLPAAMGEGVNAPLHGEPFGIADWDGNHPLLRSFVGPLAAVLRQVRVQAFLATQTPADPPASTSSRPSGTATSGPAPPLVLARYSDGQRSPAILTRPFGRGNVVLVTTSADQEWNDWGANFSFVPLVLELVAFAARASESPGQIIVGAPLVCPVDGGAAGLRCMLRPPGYPADPEIPLTAERPQGAGPRFVFDNANKVGVWSFELAAPGGPGSSRYAAVNPDPAESNLARTGRAELESALGGMKFEYVRDLATFTADTTAARQELWWPMLLAAIVVLMTEQGLAWYFGTRG